MANPQKEFWPQVKKGSKSQCWPWNGSRFDKDGYGKYRFRLREHRAHVWAWEDANNRKVPSGKLVCHTCDNPPCCNPAHLFLGTPKDNTQDMISKGRKAQTKPPIAKPHKVSAEVLEQIHALRKAGKTQKQIAEATNLSQPYVSKILRRM